jgi:hypothetical protein
MSSRIRTALALSAATVALAAISSSASAHLVQFGWQETASGTVLWGEHWHGDLSSPYTANGGIHITDVGTGTTITAQWTGVLNNTPVASLGLTGSQCDPVNPGCNTYNDWMFTVPIPLGNGVYDFFTGPECCVDTMGAPVRVTITGITTQPPGIGTGVPEPSTWAMMLIGFGSIGYAMRRRRSAVMRARAIPQLT